MRCCFKSKKIHPKEIITVVLHNKIKILEKEVNLLRKEKEKGIWKDRELVSTLCNERKNLQKKISRLEERLKLGQHDKPASASEGISDAMEAVIQKFYSQYGPKN